jgi:hypothetical protein
MGSYAGVDCNLTLCPLQSRLSTCTMGIGHGQSCARVDLNLIPKSTLSPSQRQRIWPQASWCCCLELASPPTPSLATIAIVATLLSSLWVFLFLCEKDGLLFLFFSLDMPKNKCAILNPKIKHAARSEFLLL